MREVDPRDIRRVVEEWLAIADDDLCAMRARREIEQPLLRVAA